MLLLLFCQNNHLIYHLNFSIESDFCTIGYCFFGFFCKAVCRLVSLFLTLPSKCVFIGELYTNVSLIVDNLLINKEIDRLHRQDSIF